MTDVVVTGNIGEPKLKFTPSGKAVLEFSLAENHRKKDQSGEWQDDGATWRRVSIWERKAEALGEVLKKGDRVIVTGFERLREWTAQDGTQGRTLELSARDVGIIPKSQQQGDWGASQDWGAPFGAGQDGGAPF